MTSREQFENWWYGTDANDVLQSRTSAWEAWQARGELDAKRIAELEAVIVMQRETIHTLNSCIGGEGSLTTDNLVTIGRLESKLAIAIEALEWINKSESGVAELAEALTKIKGE
jgi:uncharacterized coiled-coil protein SlyX